MADFCKKCSVEIFGEDFGDLKGLCKDDECAYALCEGCGPVWVNSEGEKLDSGDEKSNS